MDHFGIGAAMRALATTYSMTARRTGRTTSLVESVKDGDRIVFFDAREADRVRRLCQERGVTVDCIVVPVSDAGRIFERGTSKGRTIFDHSWVEKRFLQAIDHAGQEIDHLERQASGFGETHRETRRKAEEISKWSSVLVNTEGQRAP